MFNIGQKIQTKYGICVINSETQMEVVDSADEAFPNGFIIETPPIEIKQEKFIPKSKMPKTPKEPKSAKTATKTAEQELASLEAELQARKAKLASLLG